MKKSAKIVETIIQECCRKYSITLDRKKESTQTAFFLTYLRFDYPAYFNAFYLEHSMLECGETIRQIMNKISSQNT
jgi:hypothetical protein